MDNSNVSNLPIDDPDVKVVAGSDPTAIAQMVPQAMAALGGAGSKLASGYNGGQAAIRAHLEGQMGVNELDADKLVKMLIQTGHLQFVGRGEPPPAPQGQANPVNAEGQAAANADAGDSFAGEGRPTTATGASGDVAAPPDPAHIAYNPLVNPAAAAAPGNVMSVATAPSEQNVESAEREAGAVAGARAFTPAAVGGTMGYHNAGLMTAPYPIDKDERDADGDWYLLG